MVLRLGLVGHGRWGRNIERTLLSLPDVSLIVLARGVHPSAELDGVLIATPSASHAEIALPYIEAGIATFIEKPMVTTLDDASRIRDAAARSGAIVFVGHIYLHHPAFVAMLESLPRLGAIRYVLCEGVNNSPRSDCSVLWDWLPHDLSMARMIFGREPESAASWSLSGKATPQTALSKFQYGDTPLVCSVSWLSPIRRRQMTIVGEKATLVFDDKAGRALALYSPQEKDPSYLAYGATSPLTQEMDAFLQALRAGRPDTSQIEMAFNIVRAIAAAEKSLASNGAPVDI